MRALGFVLSGAVFGFLLRQARVTDYDAIAGMFLFRDFHLMGVMGSAIAVAAAGLAVFRRSPRLAGSADFKPKTLDAGVVAGSIVFGVGWALSGS